MAQDDLNSQMTLLFFRIAPAKEYRIGGQAADEFSFAWLVLGFRAAYTEVVFDMKAAQKLVFAVNH
jgi:hypothetical protein